MGFPSGKNVSPPSSGASKYSNIVATSEWEIKIQTRLSAPRLAHLYGCSWACRAARECPCASGSTAARPPWSCSETPSDIRRRCAARSCSLQCAPSRAAQWRRADSSPQRPIESSAAKATHCHYVKQLVIDQLFQKKRKKKKKKKKKQNQMKKNSKNYEFYFRKEDCLTLLT